MTVNTVDPYGLPMGGTTAQRPASGVLYDGKIYFDTTIQQLIVWSATNTAWQNMTGAPAGSTSGATATVAAAGSVIGNAAAIAAGFTWVTAADGTKGVQLPALGAGGVCEIKNDETANAILKVYPQVNTAINNIAANSAYSMAANTACTFKAFNATQVFSIPKTAS